ncbi:putative LPS assembly protein LptD [Hymenobacter rubripertinctus]|uniref:LPS-assembly protein LptD n=1 Tax=Hymenobacter rubripertinctus TaxID=2029981 RepID=A0A418QV11_9BACT|nr:putative LPS assembly protein LptD [Hymenobacter rubripertinctus]RIY08790.1 LPS-assembly protein LptD [Hymenobacter rubripertinctus]
MAGLLTLLLSLWALVPAQAQQPPVNQQQVPHPTPRPATEVTPATRVPGDVRPLPTIVNAPTPNGTVRDTAGLALSGTADSLRLGAGARKGAIETTVSYKAQDSIRFEVQNKRAILYDKAVVDYGDMNLQAALITVDYSRNLVTAEGAVDSTGKARDRPVFTQGGATYQAGRIDYNIKSRRGRITDVVTQQGEGYIHAETIKKNSSNELFGVNGRYTTCNLEDPHFYIQATKMKVMPGEQVVTGPFNLVIGDIPTPLGFLFGYFPMPKSNKRASGLIIPTFGQGADRGFFLRNGGYYWAANDHIGVRLTGDIYSGNAERFGGWRGAAEMQYITRYKFQGLFTFNYSSTPTSPLLGTTDANTNPRYNIPRTPRTFQLAWTHTPVARPGGGRFSANVNISSSSGDYYRQNSYNVRNYLTSKFSSNINYSKQLRNAPINYALQLTQSQDTRTGTMDFTLPDLTVGVARQYLYDILKVQPRKLYEQFAFSYDLTFQNKFSNNIPARQLSGGSIPLLGGSTAAFVTPIKLGSLDKLLRTSQTGMRHNFGITLGSYNVLNHLSLSPSVTYNEVWYFKKLRYSYNDVARAIAVDTITSFNRLNSYTAGLSLSTNFYGTIVRKGTHKIQALRHKVTPNLSVSYAPGPRKNDPAFQAIQLGGLRDPTTGRLYREGDTYIANNGLLLPRYNGFIYGVPTTSEVRQLSFSLQNALEMKVRDDKDTTGTTPFKKVSLIDGLDFSTGYNFAADSLQLAPLSATFRTQVARKLNITINGNFEFYQQDSLRRPIDRFLWQQKNFRLARLSTANLQLSYQFNPSQGNRKAVVRRDAAPVNDPQLGAPQQINPYEDYVNFEIPWELSTSFTASYANQGPLSVLPNRPRKSAYTAATLNLNGSVKLTETLRFGFSTNYDFINQTPAFTTLDVTKDLHCWQITGNWRPFGPTRGYFVTIAAKSALLQSLKLSRNRTFLNY